MWKAPAGTAATLSGVQSLVYKMTDAENGVLNPLGLNLAAPALFGYGTEEQRLRFEARIEDPLRQWKLSPMDLESYARWYSYSQARDLMLKATDTEEAPWHIVRSDDKRRARLNCIAHLLTLIPYKKVAREKVKLPKRSDKGEYDDQATLKGRHFVPEIY